MAELFEARFDRDGAVLHATARLLIRVFDVDDGNVSVGREIGMPVVRHAIVGGELSTGERLQPVRRLADVLDIGPGTVAKAYGELERLGLVVTEGPRGGYVSGGSSP